MGKPVTTKYGVAQLLIGEPFASIFTVQGLYGLGFEKYAPYVGLCVGLSCIGLNLLWIPQLGSYGAAYAWIVAQTMEILISGSIVIWNVKKRVNNRE